MSTLAVPFLPDADACSDADTLPRPIIVQPGPDSEERGRLKRRRLSSHSPRRASSPSRGHDRRSGSRYRHHHRNHHRPSSPTSSISPPTVDQKRTRRRSDAEPDHSFRGRARNRSGSSGKARSPVCEDGNFSVESVETLKKIRKRSQPPSRHRADGAEDDVEIRRQRGYPNLYKAERRDSKSDILSVDHSAQEGIASGDPAPVAR
ncbi:hypothetical protein NX059_011654 [Plenodomus lindquistii]|nr:hypothetical protein NX059_011654 [Plenodomus lindquistii]